MEYKWNKLTKRELEEPISLNPCFNGIQMEQNQAESGLLGKFVLILVLMEYKWNSSSSSSKPYSTKCLNPCFNGIQMEPMLKSIRFEWFEGLKV